jgi:ADP-heptose:LPS heptosyltransferase
MFFLGVPRREIPRARLFETISTNRPAKPYAVLHAVASAPEKTWPAERFVDVAKHLKRDAGLEPVFIAGPGEDLHAFQKYRCITGAPLSEVKSLLAHASMFIGNDSGPAHMAAAFGVRSAVLFGPSDHEVWAPWKTDAVVLKSNEIGGITVEQVTAALTGMPV